MATFNLPKDFPKDLQLCKIISIKKPKKAPKCHPPKPNKLHWGKVTLGCFCNINIFHLPKSVLLIINTSIGLAKDITSVIPAK